MPEQPEVLTGGNTNPAVLRFEDQVERDAGPWSPVVHQVLRHLEDRGFAAPRSRGFSATRERLTFVPGLVVHPGHWDLLASDDALAQVFRRVREMHEALADITLPPDAHWHTIGADPRGPA